MLETPSLYKDTPNTLHLSPTAMCRTSCEAVVEGMENVMNRHSKESKSLDSKTVEKETILFDGKVHILHQKMHLN